MGLLILPENVDGLWLLTWLKTLGKGAYGTGE